MARLGELLVAAGLLTSEQIEQALRAQVMWGGRLGTNLIELGFVDLDTLSKTLGRQHRLPASLARHFDRADRELQQRLSADVAERYTCVPLLRVGDAKDQIVIASVVPLDARGLAIVADELAVTPGQLVPSIAAELRIRYHLERVYKIPRGSRFLRSRGKTIPPFPHFEISPVPAEESEVDLALPTDTGELPIVVPVPDPDVAPRGLPVAAVPDPSLRDAESLAGEAPMHLDPADSLELELEPDPEPARGSDPDLERAPTTIHLELDDDPEIQVEPDVVDLGELSAVGSLEVANATADGAPERSGDETLTGRERRRYVRTIVDAPASESERQALGRIAIRRVAVSTPASASGQTLGEATRAIRRGADRDRVADLVIETIFRFATSCDAAMMLVARGEVAIGWKGFCRNGGTPPEIAVPMDQPGLVPRVIQRNMTLRSPASDLSPIDQLLMVSLGQQTGELAVVPVSIAGQVMCVLAMVTQPDAKITSAESVAAAAGAAFARLMRDASR